MTNERAVFCTSGCNQFTAKETDTLLTVVPGSLLDHSARLSQCCWRPRPL